MQSKRLRLDQFLGAHLSVGRNDVKLLLAQGRVQVDGALAVDANLLVDDFSTIVFDERILQSKQRLYFMMNKPIGVVSATKDAEHRTVIDLLEAELINADEKSSLHLAGRLDLNSSGLLLLTNDGRWSKRLSAPENNVVKRYRVGLENPISKECEQEYEDAFAKGMYFKYEDITTRPAALTILSETLVEVSLSEGRYHQIKRMFGRFRNPVISIHRLSIGGLELDSALALGQSRVLASDEIEKVFSI